MRAKKNAKVVTMKINVNIAYLHTRTPKPATFFANWNSRKEVKPMKQKRYDSTRKYNKKLFLMMEVNSKTGRTGIHLPISDRYLMKRERGLCK